ncbi:MAG: inositol 2-dehydrogenase [Pseudomonadota bacterium]
MIRFGLLGCGRIGQVHARTLARLSGATLVAVADALPEAAEALAQAHGASVQAPDDLIASHEVDAVIIGTPTTLHYDQIHAAAAAGKAIFCEKPIDLSSARVRACIEAVSDAGVPFLTAFNRRFDPNFAELERRLRAGAIGSVELVVLTSRDPAPPPIGYIESSGGLFRDMMIHDFDMARFLLDEEPVEVFATGSCLVDPAIGAAGDIDTAAVTLRTASGKLCQINNSRRATYGYDQRIEVHGATAMLSATNVLETTVEQAGPDGFTRAPNQHFFLERYERAYFAELARFVDALNTGRAPSPDASDGLRAQLLADAAARSMAEGRPVRIDAG